MKMPGKGKLPVVMILMSTYPLSAQDQTFPGEQQQFNQAGSVSVDMVTGEPIQAPQVTEILAIYRGPGYFDETLLDISYSSQSSGSEVAPPSTAGDWGDQPQQVDQQEILPPPPVLPPSIEEPVPPQDQTADLTPAPPLEQEPVPPPMQEAPQPPVFPQEPVVDAPPIVTDSVPQDGEPLPPPPMLETLPAFPQGE